MTDPKAPQAWRRPALPRGVVILVGIAAGLVALGGIRQAAVIIAPIFTALCLVVTLYPVRTWLQRHGWRRSLATLMVVLGVYAILIGLAVSFIWSLARFSALLPQYAPQMQATIDSFHQWLAGFGIGSDQVQSLLGTITPGTILSLVGGVLGAVTSLLSVLVFVLVLVLFMGLDSAPFSTRMERFRPGRTLALNALGSFAHGTRRYFAVATIFGGIVAVLDTIAIWAVGIPAPVLWGLLAFVTNYIPNIGFIIGLIPVALLALLTGGVGQMVLIIVIYCALNLVIQSILQPKFVGDAVGLTTTVSFLSLIVWAYVLGPLGAILAVPATLLVKALLVDFDEDSRWLQLFLGDQPNFDRKPKGAHRKWLHRGAEVPPAGRSDPQAASGTGTAAQPAPRP